MSDVCPKCNHKALRYRETDDNYYCNHCRSLFNENMNEIKIEGVDPLQLIRDSNGNYYTTNIETKDNQIHFTKIYYIEPNKITLNGEYPKLKSDIECKYPKRLDCNAGIGYERCEFMEYGGTLGNWICRYKKNGDR